jgi:sugar/nucleoside kinase (ribokinase family)
MPQIIYDVCAIGNAIVDVITRASDRFLKEQKMQRGAMTLIDEKQAEFLYGFMKGATQCSGGSAANTAAGLASLGAMPAFIGKVRQDSLGEIFRHDMRSIGVHFDTPALAKGKATASCCIFVTPDGQRTMNTYIGACTEVSQDDVNDALIARSLVTYIEGYLWDQPNAKEAIRKALRVARLKERKVALSLSDVFCVNRHRKDFLELIDSPLDLLFANEEELYTLAETADWDTAIAFIRGRAKVAAITRGARGSVVLTEEDTIVVPARRDIRVIDTTGAGDLYASGFLYGYTRDWDLPECAELATRCASHIIQQMGARPQTPLTSLL